MIYFVLAALFAGFGAGMVLGVAAGIAHEASLARRGTRSRHPSTYQPHMRG